MKTVTFKYKNHRGEVSERTIIPEGIEFSLNAEEEYHPQPGWVLHGFDVEKQARRSFLLVNIVMPTRYTGGMADRVDLERLYIRFED